MRTVWCAKWRFLPVVFGKCVDDFTKSRTRCGEEVHFKQFSIESK